MIFQVYSEMNAYIEFCQILSENYTNIRLHLKDMVGWVWYVWSYVFNKLLNHILHIFNIYTV